MPTRYTAVQNTVYLVKLTTKQPLCLRLVLRHSQQINRPSLKRIRILIRSTPPGRLNRPYPHR